MIPTKPIRRRRRVGHGPRHVRYGRPWLPSLGARHPGNVYQSRKKHEVVLAREDADDSAARPRNADLSVDCLGRYGKFFVETRRTNTVDHY